MSTPRFLTLPDGVRATTLSTGRGTFAALSAGSSGQPVVLVPGWTGSKEDFIAVLGPLAAAGYHAVAYDQRGQYETPGTGREADYSLAAFAEDLVAVSAAIPGGPVHILGHSFGGLVVRAAAVRRPDAFASLTFLCSGPGALPEEMHPLLLAVAEAIPSLGLEATWQAKRAYERSQGAAEEPPEIERFLERRFLANDPASLRAMTLLLTSAPDDTDEVASAAMPKLVSYGIDDDGWPLAVQRDAAARLGARIAEIDGAGHSPAVDRPEALVSALTGFLSATPASSTLG